MLSGRKVLIGVTGGIAAYKAVEVVSRLRQLGADVHVAMTDAATRLVAPLTFQAMSGNPVVTDLLGEPKRWPVEHVFLARDTALYIVAPATAHTIARLATGMADDYVGALALSVQCPVLVAPAMETHMWHHPQTAANVRRLQELGYRVMEPGEGRLASGFSGTGRMPEPESIVQRALALLVPAQDLAGAAVLVTAGATREPLDPVRYLTNHSSGKMGYALAAVAAERGAAVTLVSGPTNLAPPPGVQLIGVETALQMYDACLAAAATAQAVVAAAAVADYRFAEVHAHKVKKSGETLTVDLVRNPDILAELGRRKRDGQVLVGFAAETQAMLENARQKLAAKNLDLICANDVTAPGAGFGVQTNVVTLIDRDGGVESLPLLSKHEVAARIWDRVAAQLPARS